MGWTDRLSRRTTSGRYIPEIDGLRFVSIALVVLYHVSGYLSAKAPFAFRVGPDEDAVARFLTHGHYGVQLFFAISGFVLALPFAAQHLRDAPPVRLKAYFLRRVTRLEPPYILALVLAAVGTALVGGAAARDLPSHFAASFFYLHGLVFDRVSTILPVAWSLEVEVQFYLLAPLWGAAYYRIRHTAVRRGVLLASIAAAALLQPPADPLAVQPFLIYHFHFFLVGFLVADVYLVDWDQRPARTPWWDAGMVAAFGAVALSWVWGGAWARVAFPLAMIPMYLAAFRGSLTSRVLSARWVTLIGGMCYSIYLLHYLVISLAGRVTVGWLPADRFSFYLAAQAVLLCGAVLAVSAAFFVLVERPCMERDWPQRLAAWVAACLAPARGAPAVAKDAVRVGGDDRGGAAT